MVGRPFQRAGSSREALPESWKWYKGPPEGPGLVGMQFLCARSGRKAIPKGR